MMQQKRTIAIVLVMLSLFVIALGRRAWASDELVLTEDLVVSLALENNPRIEIAGKLVEQAKARVRAASSAKSPTLSASALYQKTYLEPQYPVYLGGSSTASGYALAGFGETWRTALTLSWVVYSSGRVEHSVRAAELAVSAAFAESERTVQAVRHVARIGYFELQRARARTKVAEEAFFLAQEHKRRVDALYRNGIVAKNELLRAEVAVSNAQLNLIRANSGTDVAISALERSVGTTIKERYDLPDPVSVPPDMEIPLDPVSIALSNRPEFRALEFSERSARSIAAAAAGEKGPSVYLKGEAFSVGDSFYPDMMDDWRISVVAEWDLYDGGRAKARMDETLAVAGELLHRIEDLKRQVGLEVSSAMMDLQSGLQRIEVARSQVALAEEDHRMAVARYSAQVGTSIDVLDARVGLTGSRVELVDAVYDAMKAYADFRFAIGEDFQTNRDKR